MFGVAVQDNYEPLRRYWKKRSKLVLALALVGLVVIGYQNYDLVRGRLRRVPGKIDQSIVGRWSGSWSGSDIKPFYVNKPCY
ncbi:hypothetical protein BH11ARM1_BH11ARM1_01650 [soil metagenome]